MNDLFKGRSGVEYIRYCFIDSLFLSCLPPTKKTNDCDISVPVFGVVCPASFDQRLHVGRHILGYGGSDLLLNHIIEKFFNRSDITERPLIASPQFLEKKK